MANKFIAVKTSATRWELIKKINKKSVRFGKYDGSDCLQIPENEVDAQVWQVRRIVGWLTDVSVIDAQEWLDRHNECTI